MQFFNANYSKMGGKENGMKKILIMFLALAMVLGAVACQQQSEPVNQPDQTADPAQAQTPAPAETDAPATPAVEYTNELIIGDITESMGDFISGWTNAASDAYVKQLMSGYATVNWTREGLFAVDELITVKEWSEVDNEDGTKTYTFTINDNLTYNNGDPITAKDYVASILLWASPQMVELGATTGTGMEFVGYAEYHNGDTNVFPGVRLLDDYTFSITIAAEELPYHYDIAYAIVGPEPIHVYAPSATISDNGEGALIEGLDVEELRTTLLTEGTGMRYQPTVTSGPYQFGSFDADTRTIVINKNDAYLGTYDGVKPKIETIIVKLVDEATQMDELRTGAVDLVAGLSGGDTINAGLDLVEEGLASYASYPRYGYGKIAFACNFGPTQFPEVRQAVAYCLDRNEFIRQYAQGFAVLVHGYYGASMREYIDNKDILEETLNQYAYNLENAKQVLIDGGWTLNAQGQPFVEGTDDIRYKEVDGELMPLIIKWCSSGNSVAELLNTMLPAEFAKVGGKIEETVADFSLLLAHYYQEGEIAENPEYHMFNMGTGFSETQAYWYYYSTDPEFFGQYNTNRITDEQLEGLAKQLKNIPYDDVETWDSTWLQFEQRWNELMPDIPLYSDDYHDFFNAKLENYNAGSVWGWEYELVYANIVGHNE